MKTSRKNTSRHIAALAAISLITTISAHAAPVDYLINGGFESGLTNWSRSSSNAVRGGCDTQWTAGASGAASGCTGFSPYNNFVAPQSGSTAAYSAFDGNGPQTIKLFQSFNYSTANSVSSASLDWYSAVGLGSNLANARVFSVDVTVDGNLSTAFSESFTNSLFRNWTPTSVDLTALLAGFGAGTHSVTVSFNQYVPQNFTGPGVFALDNTHFMIETTAAVPVPAAAWLMGSGLIGLAGLARRKK